MLTLGETCDISPITCFTQYGEITPEVMVILLFSQESEILSIFAEWSTWSGACYDF
jgi:hypothetical protein